MHVSFQLSYFLRKYLLLASWEFICLKFDEHFLNQRWISTSNFSIPFKCPIDIYWTYCHKSASYNCQIFLFSHFGKNIEVSIQRAILELPNCDNPGWWKWGILIENKYFISKHWSKWEIIFFSFYIIFWWICCKPFIELPGQLKENQGASNKLCLGNLTLTKLPKTYSNYLFSGRGKWSVIGNLVGC